MPMSAATSIAAAASTPRREQAAQRNVLGLRNLLGRSAVAPAFGTSPTPAGKGEQGRRRVARVPMPDVIE